MYQPGSKSQKESDFDESQDIYEKYYGAGNTKVYLEKMCKFFHPWVKRNLQCYGNQIFMVHMINIIWKIVMF